MLLIWHMGFLRGQKIKVLANSPPRGRGFNDVVHVAANSRWERVAKLLNVFLMAAHVIENKSTLEGPDGQQQELMPNCSSQSAGDY